MTRLRLPDLRSLPDEHLKLLQDYHGGTLGKAEHERAERLLEENPNYHRVLDLLAQMERVAPEDLGERMQRRRAALPELEEHADMTFSMELADASALYFEPDLDLDSEAEAAQTTLHQGPVGGTLEAPDPALPPTMDVAEAHRDLLDPDEPFDLACDDLAEFDVGELDVLDEYGPVLDGLMSGALRSGTPDEEQFYETCHTLVRPEGDEQRVWRKLLRLRGASLFAQKRHTEPESESGPENQSEPASGPESEREQESEPEGGATSTRFPTLIPPYPPADAPDTIRFVFGRLRAGLPATWTVLQSLRDPVGADFVVFDPDRGALAVRVAGADERGSDEPVVIEPAAIEPATTRRSFTPLRMRAFDLLRGSGETRQRRRQRSPYRQRSTDGTEAERAAQWLADHLANMPCGWALALPDGADARADRRGVGVPREQILDRHDLLYRLRPAIDRAFEASLTASGSGLASRSRRALRGAPALARARARAPAPARAGDPGQDRVRAAIHSLAPALSLVKPLAQQFDQERPALVRLTREQTEILDVLHDVPRASIEGAAGTGKTLLAAEQARRLAEAGQRVVLLCFNRLLADHLSARSEGYDVNSFHGLCHDLCVQAGIDFEVPTVARDARPFWEERAPQLLERALEALPGERWNAVIVDEAQDFRSNWWPVLDQLLRDPETGSLVAFYDPNQKIFTRGSAARPLESAPITLHWNCRNTERIARFSAAVIQTEPGIKPGAPRGATVERIRCSDGEREMVAAVERTLQRLIEDEQIRPDQIVVLSTRAAGNGSLGHREQLGSVRLVPLEAEPGPNEVRSGSLQRFKGLESDVVILTDVRAGDLTSSPTHVYVGASRARHLLVVVEEDPAG